MKIAIKLNSLFNVTQTVVPSYFVLYLIKRIFLVKNKLD